MALDINFESISASRAKMKIFSSVPGCIESLAQLCDNGIRTEVADKAIVAEGKQLIIHFVGKKVPKWCIDKMNEHLSADDRSARATVFNSTAR